MTTDRLEARLRAALRLSLALLATSASLFLVHPLVLAEVPEPPVANQVLTASDLAENFSYLEGLSTALDAKIAALDARTSALEAAPEPLTTVVLTSFDASTAWYAECLNQTGAFIQGACERMAHEGCTSAGFKDGWFQGGILNGNIYAVCIK
jgi:hypothetical protein